MYLFGQNLVQDFVFTFVKYTNLKEYSIATALKSSFIYEQISSIYAFFVFLFFFKFIQDQLN